MADYFLPLSRRKTKRDSDILHGLLSEWYGKATADNEITARLPQAEQIGDAVQEALGKLLSGDTAVLIKIKSEWDSIAGRQLAKYITPAGMQNRCLYIEVSHPAWLMEFNEAQKNMLLQKIQEYVGKSKCTALRLVPQGRNRSEKRKY